MTIPIKPIAIGLGLTAAIGVGAYLLTGCAKDPDEAVDDKFGNFDRAPKDNAWTPNELIRNTRSGPYYEGQFNRHRVGDDLYFDANRYFLESTSNMTRAFDAAKGADSVATFDEMQALMMKYDADGNGELSSGEREKFDRLYGVTSTSRRDYEGIVGRVIYDYFRDDYYPTPDYGHTSPGDSGYGGHTSPGDSPSTGGNYGGGTSPGDSGSTGSSGSSGGTSSGDSGSSSGSSGSSSSGNSSSNGNPGYDDF